MIPTRMIIARSTSARSRSPYKARCKETLNSEVFIKIRLSENYTLIICTVLKSVSEHPAYPLLPLVCLRASAASAESGLQFLIYGALMH